jgi:GTPase SAR1 family protein
MEWTRDIWIIGPPGSGKTTLLLWFPQSMLRTGKILVPQDRRTADKIYTWQHNFFQRGEFPASGDQQIRPDRDFSFSLIRADEWQRSYEENRGSSVLGMVKIHDYPLSLDSEVLLPEALLSDGLEQDLGIALCVDITQLSYSLVGYMEKVVDFLYQRNIKRKQNSRLALVITRSELAVHQRSEQIWEYISANSNGLEDRRLLLDGQDILDKEAASYDYKKSDGNVRTVEPQRRIEAYVRDILWGRGKGNISKQFSFIEYRLFTATAVGIATDQQGLERPNVTNGTSENPVTPPVEGPIEAPEPNLMERTGKVFDRLQLWSSGIDSIFTHTLGSLP